VDWVFKTSFISIIHGVSKLTQEKNYIKDRQLNYQNYVNEVKPYKTKLREYVLNYQYNEITDGLAVTDFDIPAYYDKDFEIFRSPNGQSPAVDSNLFSNDSRYQDWKNHYKYEIGNIDVVNSGIGHLTAPDISIEPIDTTGVVATVNSIINSAGQVIGADIKNPGGGYTQTPIINVSGTGTLGTNDPFGTKLSVRLDNKKIRKIKTSIKFDRITYNSEVVEWQPGVAYAANVLVSYQGIGYITSNTVPASQTFSSGLFTKVDSSSYTNASDRIISYYSPTSEMIPKVLDRLMTGISNPIVTASDGDIDTFIEGGNFTGISTPVSQLVAGERYIITSVDGTDFTLIGALDNKVGLIFTATGAGSGDGEAVQVIDAAAFSNIGGLSPDDIVVTGGAFVDRIFSHAPEEMLPGMTYDTVSFKVIDNSLTGEIGYRRFIDIEGNVYNSVINENTITTLAQDLNISDSTITVADASTLPTPSVLTLQPGILHINGERIEYYTKTNNVLGQLRRGSGGTAIALVHKSGSSVETTNDEILIPFE
jgi:hypothetical protein